VGEDRLPLVLPQRGSTSVQHLHRRTRQRNAARYSGLGHRLTMQDGNEHLSGGGIAAGLDQRGGHPHARDVGVQVEVGPLQNQRLPDTHPRAQQHKHHVVQVARTPGATQQPATSVSSSTAVMGSRQLKQVAGLLN
jgi:hypothetical protein